MSWLGKMMGGKTGTAADRKGAAVAGARLFIGRQEYELGELGVRTFRIHPYEGELIEKQHVSFTLLIILDNEEFSHQGLGLVREISNQQGLLVQFTRPQPFFDGKLMDFLARRKLEQKGGR